MGGRTLSAKSLRSIAVPGEIFILVRAGSGGVLCISILIAAVALAAPPLTAGAWPDYVTEAATSIATNDSSRLARAFSVIQEVKASGDRAKPISAASALVLLSACSPDSIKLFGESYALGYLCLGRRLKAKGCDSGDLQVSVAKVGATKSFVVWHRRRLTLDCPSLASPTPKPALFSADDYPPLARRNGWQGDVVADLTVGTDGSVKRCSIFQSSGYALLDQATCDIFRQRARFKPATDGVGNPIESNYHSSIISWRL